MPFLDGRGGSGGLGRRRPGGTEGVERVVGSGNRAGLGSLALVVKLSRDDGCEFHVGKQIWGVETKEMKRMEKSNRRKKKKCRMCEERERKEGWLNGGFG